MRDASQASRRLSPLAALVRLELRRCMPPLRSGAVIAAGGTALVLLSGTARRELLALPVSVVGLSLTMTVAMNGLRDRMDHGLEFIQSLPVEPEVAAAARMAACAILCAIGAVLTTTGLSIGLSETLGRAPGATWLAFAALAVWGGLFLLGSLLCGALLRYSQARLRLVPPVFTVALVALIALPDAWLPSERAVLALLLSPWFPAVAPALVWALGLAAAWAAHRMLTVAIRDFSPVRDKIEW